MRKMRKKSILTVMMAAAVIITMCFAGNQLTANASTAGQIKAATVSFTLSESGHNVTVHWKTVKGASGYQIANDATPGKHMKIQWTGKNGNNKYTSVRKTAGRTYRYKMRCFIVQNGVRIYSKWSSAKSILFTAGNKPGTPKITKASSAKTSVTLTWSKAKKADGYSVYKYNGKKYVKIKTLKARTYTIKKLKADTTYKFKVRAYNNAKGKTYYSDMSKVKIIKTKSIPVKASVSDVTVDSGSTATFKVTVTAGTKPYTYQWYKGGTAIAGATSAAYTTEKLSTSDSGTKYKCRVTNPAGYIEATGTLTVNYVAPSRTVIKSWNIGAANGTTDYDGSNGTSSVVATLYSDGELAVTGSGDTVVFGTATSGTRAYKTPWNLAGEASAITSTTIASGVTPTNMGHWYEGCAITAAPAIPSSVENMDSTFLSCSLLTTAPDLSGCTNLSNMFQTFAGCKALTTAPTIPSSVWKMTSTFYSCTALTTAPTIPGSVLTMSDTFSDCTALTGTMLIEANPYYSCDHCFYNAATNSAGLTVNYTSISESFVDTIISTWGPSGTDSQGKIYKGTQQ